MCISPPNLNSPFFGTPFYLDSEVPFPSGSYGRGPSFPPRYACFLFSFPPNEELHGVFSFSLPSDLFISQINQSTAIPPFSCREKLTLSPLSPMCGAVPPLLFAFPLLLSERGRIPRFLQIYSKAVYPSCERPTRLYFLLPAPSLWQILFSLVSDEILSGFSFLFFRLTEGHRTLFSLPNVSVEIPVFPRPTLFFFFLVLCPLIPSGTIRNNSFPPHDYEAGAAFLPFFQQKGHSSPPGNEIVSFLERTHFFFSLFLVSPHSPSQQVDCPTLFFS